MPIVNQNIKILRKRLGLTQEKFAEKLGIKRSLVGAYEENRAIPPAENLKKIAETFQISLDQLLNQSFEKTTIGLTNMEPVSKGFYHDELEFSFETKPVVESDRFTAPISNKQGGNENTKIRYISENIVSNYISEIKSADFLENLPCLVLPFLPKGYLRAFDAPADFLLNDCILIGERVENFDLIKQAENHLIISKQGLGYRRVYNQIAIKNCLLLSSDKANLGSYELPISEVLELWLVKSYFSKNMPMPTNSINGIQTKIHALKSEIDDLVNRQSKM